MKKARATKILCAVLTVIMVLGTGLSAMAAVTSTSVVKYNADNTAYGVTTEVSGLTANEMVTYLVHNASSMYNVAPANIDFIDQKNATGTTAQFNYKGTGDWTEKANKIYVGAESIAAPVESSAVLAEEGVAVTVNGILQKGVEIEGKAAAGIKKLALDYAAKIVDVKYNGATVDFFVVDGAICFYTDAALNEETDSIAMTTSGAEFVGDPTANGVLSAADIINMGLAVQPGETASSDTVTYSNGQMASWNGFLANVKNVSGGENVAAAFWYPNATTLANAGYETDIDIYFASKAPLGTSEHAIGLDYGAIIAAYESKAKYSLDVSEFIPQGLTLHKNGADIEFELTVPATGDYKLIARQNVWEAKRMTTLTINGTALRAASDANQKLAFAKSADVVTLEAGQTYTATLDGSESAPVRLDFLALVPVALADSISEIAADIEYIDDYLTLPVNKAIEKEIVELLAAGASTEGEAGAKLGTVKVDGNTLIAFGKAKGAYAECGILISAADTYVFPALGVAGNAGAANGGFAIELIDEDGVDLAEEFAGAEVYAYAAAEGEDPTDGNCLAGPVVLD